MDTPRKGNQLLEFVFECLNSKDGLIKDIPPFFIFKKTGCGWDVKFLGLAAPGNPKISPDRDLVAFWRTMNEERFQNYEAYFTVLSTEEAIDRRWLNALIYDHENSIQYAPDVWKSFINKGRNGIIPLIAKRILDVPSKYDQLQSDVEGQACLAKIRDYYTKFPQGFEVCAKSILEKIDPKFQDFELTRPWRDGGRDAVGYYVINSGGKANAPLRIDCALEAKCYSEKNSVGVREMSRLISRIRYRQFGVMITTSYVDKQAYKEVMEDGHPILIVTASDIAQTLRHNAITSNNIDEWLISLDESDTRMKKRAVTYVSKLVESEEK